MFIVSIPSLYNSDRLQDSKTADEGEGDAWPELTPPELWGAWSYPLTNGMHKLNLVKVYRLGVELSALLRSKANESPGETYKRLAGPIDWLVNFSKDMNNVPAPKTKAAAMELCNYLVTVQHEAFKGVVSDDASEKESVIVGPVIVRTKKLWEAFEREFEHESREISVLSVPDRCAYSTTILIERGEDLLPEAVRQSISAYARNEIHEAGKCLAFNVSTAAGFHLMRGVESILRNYYDALSGRAPRPKLKNGNDAPMGAYIDQVQKWAEPKVIATLRQITSLHRNPLSHPNDVLTDEDAVVLVGVVVSAVTGMVNDAKAKGHTALS